MEITLYRDKPLEIETRTLPAGIYNLAHSLMTTADQGCVFVPIRSLQYLAILDAEEIVFVDSQYKSRVEVAWRRFHPQARTALDEAVPFECHYYEPEGRDLMRRLPVEFAQALRTYAARQPKSAGARVLKFERSAP
jgi:hypothetical protein